MKVNGTCGNHWYRVFIHCATDALAIGICFFLASQLRLGDGLEALWVYWPGILLGAIVYPSAAYACGLYSPRENHELGHNRLAVLLLCYAGSLLAMVILFYLQFSFRIGRGVMLLSIPLALAVILFHHHLIWRRLNSYSDRVALIVASAADERELALIEVLGSSYIEVVGVICDPDYHYEGPLPTLGSTVEMIAIVHKHNIFRVISTDRVFHEGSLCRAFCSLRYSGVTVMPLIGLCEEAHHCVPLELVTPNWLMNASGSPHFFYIKKLKRAFDVITAMIGLGCLGPICALAALAVKLSSHGPIIYRQTRAGRLGKTFEVLKLRTMACDAEKDGPVWARANDERVTMVGGFLRKYRIDEVPQLINVLRGEMSLVGPRPERPEFVRQLEKTIPHFLERLMVQPGITGWAQVNFPYGASHEDTIRKLEYDLYYTKHMSFLLDVFVLLDTFRIILCGGSGTPGTRVSHSVRRAMLKTLHIAEIPVAETPRNISSTT